MLDMELKLATHFFHQRFSYILHTANCLAKSLCAYDGSASE